MEYLSVTVSKECPVAIKEGKPFVIAHVESGES
jgi:hypothetical protein